MKRKLDTTRIVFILYCFVLIWLVIFKLSFSMEGIQGLKIIRSINIIPFHYDLEVGRVHLKEVVMNVIAFIPMGLYFSMLNISGKKSILYGIACSFLFELCQFILAIGASDITDIITNTSGTIIGIVLYSLARTVFKNKQKLDKVINRIGLIVLTLFLVLLTVLIVANS